MPTIAEVREKFPQYADLSDQQLAEGLHKRFYSDLPFNEFAQKIGYSQGDQTQAPDLGALQMSAMPGIARGLGRFADFADKELTPAKAAVGATETAGNVGSSMVSMPASGLAGLMTNPISPGGMAMNLYGKVTGKEVPTSAEVVEKVQNALTYQPRTAAGQLMTMGVTAPFNLLEKGADRAGDVVNQATGSPLAATATKTGIEGIPLLIGKGKGAKVKAPALERLLTGEAERIAGDTPKERAQNFVNSRTSLVWDDLSGDFQRRLKEVAATGSNLERLDGAAIERQALLASLEVPIKNPTRGQVTREPLQQRTEQLAKATEAGAPLREIDISQNKALQDNLDVLKSRTGGKASGELQTGMSVQNALRARKALEDVKVRKLYDDAEKAGIEQGPVNIDGLVDYLAKHEDPTRVSYATDKLKALKAITTEETGGIAVSQARPLTFKELEGIRKAASNAAKSADGTTRHYSKELRDVIETQMENAGGVAGQKYAQARAARKAVGEEFERTQAVARLVSNRKMSKDRATALEDTWHKTVLGGSLDDLKAVRGSLEKSEKGRQAWNDMRAATVDYIKDKATGGKLGLKNEAGDLNATWVGLRRAVDDIGPDKMREIFGAEDAARIEKLVEAAQILKTEAPTGVKGSPTFDKILTLLDKFGGVPGLGKPTAFIGGAIKGVAKLGEIGKAGRDVRKAQTTPLDEAARR